MRVAVVAHGHFPVVEPFAGGLEAFTSRLVRGLRRRGHEVLLYAAEGTDEQLADELVTFEPSPARLGPRRPTRTAGAPDPVDRQETRAYLEVVRDLAGRGRSIDVVANHTLQPTVLALSAALDPPVVSTFHTPLLEPVADAMRLADHRARYLAVSASCARAWAPAGVDAQVVLNGVDLEEFVPGPGGGRAVWTGRLTPDKGADIAIVTAQRAGIPLDLVGPISDPDWFEAVVRPLLGADVRHLGALDHAGAARVVGSSAVALVTPRWEEPFGLVAAEALVCGTPVVALDRGALPEIVDTSSGVVVPPADGVDALARAVGDALRLDRQVVAAVARERFSLERMLDEHEAAYLAAASAG